ncbi:prepilin-type N-terminal cleavage/methylation domain-containing protein [Puniceicoccales bacterium CK1056]|uniref:Prepilin-type N-terminal cleavage/methylation domain-containing protein n=1 Tax=Oceanipulchritudo coccoides TaxID=2706888 RepID=A0A6B2M3G4_9BACT|nr:prepilin-type N-terminal cleavage/methylation domain-containing protein [Oceanipulchritudo coccoides]NDV62956.1 prepilin-type N-terminal cleavage/methylation domain-containing protein [Oceanipulchritudo coccoides]
MKTVDKLYTNKTGGFTLVEVIIGSVLMAIVFTASYASYFLGMNLVEDAREELRASQIIQSELERMRTMNWDAINSVAQVTRVIPQGDFIQKFSGDYRAYREIKDIDGQTNLKMVRVFVWWTNAKGLRTYQVFNTIVTKEGLNDYHYRKV